MSRKLGAVSLWGEGLGPYLTQCGQGRGPPTFVVRTKWHLDPSSHLATIDIGRKLGAFALPLLFGEGEGWAGSISNTMWRGPRPTSVPSGIFNNPAVWPVATMHQRHEQDRQDNGPIL